MFVRVAAASRVVSVLGALAVFTACETRDTEMVKDEEIAAGIESLAVGNPAFGGFEDPQLLGYMLMVDSAEIEAGRLAQQKAQNADVREFARLMVNEHSGMRRMTNDIVSAGTVTPRRPGNVTGEEHRRTMDTLRAASGATFDSVYIASQIRAHEQALERLRGSIRETNRNPQLQQHLERAIAAVDRHLQAARETQEKLLGPGAANRGTAGRRS